MIANTRTDIMYSLFTKSWATTEDTQEQNGTASSSFLNPSPGLASASKYRTHHRLSCHHRTCCTGVFFVGKQQQILSCCIGGSFVGKQAEGSISRFTPPVSTDTSQWNKMPYPNQNSSQTLLFFSQLAQVPVLWPCLFPWLWCRPYQRNHQSPVWVQQRVGSWPMVSPRFVNTK